MVRVGLTLLGWGGMSVLLMGLVPAPTPVVATCVTDDDCPTGSVCEQVGTLGCAVPDCAPDAPCEPIACDPVPYAECVPAPCEVDADCPEGLACVREEYESCSAPGSGPCEPNGDCPPPAPAECFVEVVTDCRAPWEGTCTENADCGPGFSCEKVEVCSCDSPAAPRMVPPPENEDGGVPDGEPEPLPTTCSCEYTGIAYCQPMELPCDGDQDCEAGLTCVTIATSNGCTAAADRVPAPAPVPPEQAGSDGDSDGGSSDPAGDTAGIACQTETIRWCLPPGYTETVPVGVPARDDDGGTQTDAEGTPAPSPGPMAPAANDTDGNAPVDPGHDADGAGLLCATVAPGTGGQTGWLALAALPLALLWRRRR